MVNRRGLHSNRAVWLDAARGMCMVAVVLGHVIESSLMAGSSHRSTGSWVFYQIYLWHVPSLFFMSGLISVKFQQSSHKLKAHSSLYVYLLWCSLQTICIMLIPDSIPNLGYADLLLIPVMPNTQFWFLWALVIFQFLCRAPIWLQAVAVVMCLLLLVMHPADSVYYRVAYNLPFYGLGRLLPAVADFFDDRPWRWNFASVAILSFLMLGASWVSGEIDGLSLYSPAAFPVGFLGIIWLVALSRTILWRSSLLQWIGRESLAILVMHLFFTGGIRIIFPALTGVDDPLVVMSLMLVGGVVGPMVARAVFEKVGIDQWLGLASLRGIGARRLSGEA